jgi:hypothetical protein
VAQAPEGIDFALDAALDVGIGDGGFGSHANLNTTVIANTEPIENITGLAGCDQFV